MTQGGLTTHYVVNNRAVEVFGTAKGKVPYKIRVWLTGDDEPLEIEWKYPEHTGDWLTSAAADEGARMAVEGFWFSDGSEHWFTPPHRITLIEMKVRKDRA